MAPSQNQASLFALAAMAVGTVSLIPYLLVAGDGCLIARRGEADEIKSDGLAAITI